MVTAFTQLLALVGLEEKWTGFIIDWIDWNGTPSIPEGAEDSVYMGQTLPYRAANRYITSASELLALPGFGRDRYLKLAPYVTALPLRHASSMSAPPRAVLDAFTGKSEYSARPGGLPEEPRAGQGLLSAEGQDYQKSFDPKDWAGSGAPQARPRSADAQ